MGGKSWCLFCVLYFIHFWHYVFNLLFLWYYISLTIIWSFHNNIFTCPSSFPFSYFIWYLSSEYILYNHFSPCPTPSTMVSLSGTIFISSYRGVVGAMYDPVDGLVRISSILYYNYFVQSQIWTQLSKDAVCINFNLIKIIYFILYILLLRTCFIVTFLHRIILPYRNTTYTPTQKIWKNLDFTQHIQN